MPWDVTKLCILENDQIIVIAEGDESCAEPVWSPDGTIFFVVSRILTNTDDNRLIAERNCQIVF
jgi:hypothetical protein